MKPVFLSMTPSTIGEPDNEQKIDDDILQSELNLLYISKNVNFYNRQANSYIFLMNWKKIYQI